MSNVRARRIRPSRRLAVLLAAIGLSSAGLAGATASAAHADAGQSGHAYLRSAHSWKYVSTEAGWSGGGIHSKNVLRARATHPGAWEGYELRHARDVNPAAPAAEVRLWSDVSQSYVSAEFGWSGNARGALHARPGQRKVGAWETFQLVATGGGTFALSVSPSSGQRFYVSAEEGWPGDGNGVLRARATRIGPWEQFATGPGSRNLRTGDDYPVHWKNQGKDVFANQFGLNRECVSFVAWKIYENSGGRQDPGSNAVPSDFMTYAINVDTDWGNASNWSRYASAHGVGRDNKPTPGSVAQWDVGGGMSVGHVAYVTAVGRDGSIDVEQYNLREDGRYSTLHFPKNSGVIDRSNGHGPWTVRWPDDFVHINGF